jgi:hypothetical protein
VKLQFLKEESEDSSSDGLIVGPRKMTAIGRGRSNELVAEMDGNGKWANGQALDVVVQQMEEAQQKAALLKSLSDRQKEVLNIVKNEWINGERSTVEMVAGNLFGGPPNEDSKRKARATLDQLKEKGLVDKVILIDECRQFTVYWPIENDQAEGSEAPEASRSKVIDDAAAWS